MTAYAALCLAALVGLFGSVAWAAWETIQEALEIEDPIDLRHRPSR